MKSRIKKVAVIGAGASGLTAIKRLTESGNSFDCCVFEQSDNIGGTWVYSDDVGKDVYGMPVHSSMYKNLRTNLPKEIMEMPEYPHNGPEDRSYLTSEEVLEYFKDYAQHFDLHKYIKFRHHVKKIIPCNGNWMMQIVDLKMKKELTYYFDGVIICVGNYSNPLYPTLKGIENFKGIQIHSHNYREPTIFQDMKVLVIGSGPSGLDITFHTAPFAQKVILSHHNTKISKIKFPNNVIQKPDIKTITSTGVIFNDDTFCEIDTIIYCTGYRYNYPFLDEKCGITVEDMRVTPLYKHFININYPSMCFIGIPREIPGFFMFDLQVRCFLKILNGFVKLPSKNEMMKDTLEELESRKLKGQQPKQFHIMRNLSKQYFDSLASLGNLESIKPVVLNVYVTGLNHAMEDFTTFRNMKYKLIDDEHYIMEVRTNK